MGGVRVGILGTEADARAGGRDNSSGDIFGGGDPPGILGSDDPIPLDVSRTIAKVTKDWDPPNPRATPPLVVQGNTLERVARALNALPEWGEGGGRLRTDGIGPGNSTNLTVNLHANLVRRLPTWTGYAAASAAAKAEWDQMFAKLSAHEDRHVAIAIEEAESLAQDLVGHDIADIAKMVTDANRRMQSRQNDLDTDTDHGAKPRVQYGDVIIDTTVV